ncbi:MAG: radical SAM protein [Kiritimatiellaeota bacterium]|nr:radical SAM protein [Kiritimatiellota bacterium]
MTLVKLHDDSFTRFYDGFAYLVNQRTKVDHLFNETEQPYLRRLARTPRTLDSAIDDLARELEGIHRFDVEAAFKRFVAILEAEKFVVTGRDENELARKSARVYDFPVILPAGGPVGVPMNSAAWFYDYFQRRPTVFGMQIDVTSACNLRCVHCYYPPGGAGRPIDTALALDVLAQLPEMGTLSITFSGGEPFAHRDFDRILQAARRNDLTITVLTNGTLIDDDWGALLKEVNVNTVQLSVYSLKEEDHDAITGVPGSLRQTLQAIDRLQAIGITLSVSCHIMKPNRHSYRALLPWAAERNIKFVTDFIMLARTDFTDDNLDNRLDFEETEQVIREMLAYDKDGYASGTERPDIAIDPQTFRDRSVCGAGFDGICMSANGDFYPCSGFMGYRLGNATRTRLADVWRDSPGLRELRGLKWGDFPQCLTCEAFQFCSMCYARNFNAGQGDLRSVPEHNCRVSFLNKRLVQEHWRNCSHTGVRR